jgi:single-stranded-DNA-specific exonuclease
MDGAQGAVRPAALGVERSLLGKRWQMRAADDRSVIALAQRHALAEPLARVLAARGVGCEDAESFLAPSLRALLPDPYVLKDMAPAAERLAAAVQAGETITVFADYDVDGATASAVLRRYLALAGLASGLYVPDRLREGYGPNAEALLRLRTEGATLVVTVDCGIGAHGALAAAAAAGLDVIVVDHHQPGPALPPALAVINPKRLDEDGALGHLAACGVAFLLAVAVNRCLRRAGWFASRPEPDLRWLLDLVALGTVCDLVPLTGLNRAFVRQGLRVLARRQNPGLRTLADLAGVKATPTAHDLAFVLGPRINAGGRVGRAGDGARLLSLDDETELLPIAGALDRFNRERQRIEQAVFDEALACLAGTGEGTDEGGAPVWAEGAGWHAGVVGIVASRLVERFHRPAIVVAREGSGGADRATGSCRSVPGFDIGAAIAAADDAGLLLKGGGHAMAGGFSTDVARLGPLRALFAARWADAARHRPAPVLDLDGLLGVPAASPSLLAALADAAPFGVGNPEPRFAFSAVRIVRLAVVKDAHIGCTLVDAGGGRIDAFAFRAADGALGRALRDHAGQTLHVAGRIGASPSGGRVRLTLEDAAFATGP